MARRLLLALLLLVAAPALAQDTTAANGAIASLADAAKDYQAIDAAFGKSVNASERRALPAQARAVGDAADHAVATLNDQMALVDARIAQLGPPTPNVTEAPDIRAQRRQLGAARSTLDSAIKRGKLLGVEADQLAQEITDSESEAFNERISARAPSPLTPDFWRQFSAKLPHDLHRVGVFMDREGQAMSAAFRRGRPWLAILGIIIALVLLFPVRTGLTRLGRTFMIARAPDSRLRRSGLALWIAVSGTLTPGLAAIAFVNGLDGAQMIAPAWDRLFDALVRIGFVAGALNAVSRALLQPAMPSWRLATISDLGAVTLRHWARVGTGVLVATALFSAFIASAAGGGGPLSLTADVVSVALNVLLAGGILRSIGTLRRQAAEGAEAASAEGGEHRQPPSSGAGLGMIALGTWAAMLSATLSVATGYFALGLSIAQMMLWWPLVAATLYLLLLSTDDLCTDLIARESRLGRFLIQGFGIRGTLIDQAGVFLSAVLRLLFLGLAFTLAMGPFGSNATSLLDIVSQASAGLTIGEITVSPGAILRGFLVLAAGLFVVRVFQRWLVNRYLPATEFDPGARNSIAMVARYTGLILASLWALASLGIGLERIALLLSALSVGIGFGLQAITQNFVSGLILLAERPVKIGDWVRIGTDEGDIKRISVRATEIQIADKSTLIVPNSELITKAVLNKTLSDPVGRIQLQFSIPLGADATKAREMLLAIYAETAAVLDDPAPSVFIDGIADGRVAFNSFAYVRGPRDVYGARSAILFRLLADLPAAGIELGTTPQQMEIIGGGSLPAPAEGPPPPAGT